MNEKLTKGQRDILLNMVPGGWYTAHSLDVDNVELEHDTSAAPDWVKIELRHLAQRGILERIERGKGPYRYHNGDFETRERAPKYRLTARGEEIWRSLTGVVKED